MQTIRNLKRLRAQIYKGFKNVRVQGIPPGINLETLSEVYINYFGTNLSNISLKDVSYEHLSGWKESAAYRLWIRSKNGRSRHIIYKNSVYSIDQIPALSKLPVFPGFPEYLIYRNLKGRIAQYLPEVYFCREIIPGKHYQYLLEDLSEEYCLNCGPKKIEIAAKHIPIIHSSIEEWILLTGKVDLLSYDYQFSQKLQAYAEENLNYYAQNAIIKPDSKIFKLLEIWPKISEIYIRKEFYEYQAVRPIHGDFNLANILVSKKDESRIKVLDWEWAGLGVAHADLASLLKRASPKLEKKALQIFAKSNTQISLAEHKRLYEWCQLERGLLDSAFLAVQQMGASVQTKINLSKYIEDSIHRVLISYRRLA